MDKKPLDIIGEKFKPSKAPQQMHPLVLAYMGDAVYELFVRQYLLTKTNHKPYHLQQTAVSFVSAKAQAQALEKIAESLTEEEREIVRRGRNAKSGTIPKNTSVTVYRHSTAFECLIGYLYCNKQYDRLQEIVYLILNARKED